MNRLYLIVGGIVLVVQGPAAVTAAVRIVETIDRESWWGTAVMVVALAGCLVILRLRRRRVHPAGPAAAAGFARVVATGSLLLIAAIGGRALAESGERRLRRDDRRRPVHGAWGRRPLLLRLHGVAAARDRRRRRRDHGDRRGPTSGPRISGRVPRSRFTGLAAGGRGPGWRTTTRFCSRW